MIRPAVLLLLCLACLACLARGHEPALVPVGAAWGVRAASPADPLPPDWREPGFADQGWARYLSGFTQSPWGTEASVIPLPPADGAWCLRAGFELEDPSRVKWLVLRMDWTGGFVAHLNGVEIARRHLPGEPGTPVPVPTTPGVHADGVPESFEISIEAAGLVSGRNVLAVQWHPPPGSSYATLVPELVANFSRGPFVQNTTPVAQTVVWRTPVPASTVVELAGPGGGWSRVFEDPQPVTNHVAALTGLEPGTEYEYRVVSEAGGRVAVSPVHRFRTFREGGGVRFMVTADVGDGGQPQYDVAEVMRRAAPDLVLVPGDTVYPRFTDALADQRFFSVYRRQMTGVPFFVVPGNHDTTYGPPDDFINAFVCPTNSMPPGELAAASTWPEAYYSFDHGDAHFTGLCLPLYYKGLELKEGSTQWRWLAADLAASRKPWKFIFLHLPLMSSGPHGDDDYNYNGLRDTDELASVLLPLARQHGVQMIFSGHDHAYERFRPVQGVHCIVTGGGGGDLYALEARVPTSAQFHLRFHCVQVDVAGDELHLRAVDRHGVVFDEMFVARGPGAVTEAVATWHTPAAPVEPVEPDGDGNETGEVFDFAGPWIATAPGADSNLGRCWVNQDHEHLHLGLAGVMIPDGGNVFLFVETPGAEGVATMAGLGNGVVDPEGEGVDGLDFLENLAFAGFRPSVAVVAGDEYGDGVFRGFWRTNVITDPWGAPLLVRTNLALPVGQGVFRLAPGFPEVPGARLRQVNRSPQSGPVAGEQNADFIQVSLPMAALGLRGGETIRLGAVVGGTGFVTDPGIQARELDRAFLGARLEGSGLGAVVLEGLPVRLGEDLDADGDGLTLAEEMAAGTRPDLADTDGDTLPDGWEVRHGLHPLRAEGEDGGRGDPDGDGADNAHELAAGTRPRDTASVLRVWGSWVSGGGFDLEWSAVPGRWYVLERAGSPAGVFEPPELPGFPRRAVGDVEHQRLPAGEGLVPGFYRVRVLPSSARNP